MTLIKAKNNKNKNESESWKYILKKLVNTVLYFLQNIDRDTIKSCFFI